MDVTPRTVKNMAIGEPEYEELERIYFVIKST
jgi:hypothetical protein